MVLCIIAVVFILGITFVHSLYGLFSGLIDLFCCVVAVAVAFGFADQLNEVIAAQGLHPAYTLPCCFLGLFAVTHIVLRVAADNFIRGNVHVPMYVDWIGGGVCGFCIAMLTVGTLVLGFLMLPWGGPPAEGGGQVMMFGRYTQAGRDPQTQRMRYKRNSVWLKPDEFAVGLFNLLSGGSLRGHTTFASVYPDFPEWVFWTGNTVQPESTPGAFRDDKGNGWGPNGIKTVSWWWQQEPLEVRYRLHLPTKEFGERDADFDTFKYRVDAASGRQLLGMRLALTPGSADRDEGTPYHRLRCTMIRVVGDVRGEPRHYAARILGGTQGGSDELRLADLDTNFALPSIGGDTPIDVYFEVDEGFQPRFVEYRRHARAAVTGAAGQPPRDRLVGRQIESQSRDRLAGAARFMDAIIKEGTGDLSKLPFSMSASALTAAGVELSEGRYLSGRVSGFRSRLAAVGPGSVEEFAVPREYKLFQLRFKAHQAQSLAGQVFDFVGSVTNTYTASGWLGRFPLCGYYAIIRRDGQEYIELVISGEPNSPTFRGMLDFQSIRNPELRDPDTIIGLLFYVRPDDHIKRVQNQAGQGVEFAGEGYYIAP